MSCQKRASWRHAAHRNDDSEDSEEGKLWAVRIVWGTWNHGGAKWMKRLSDTWVEPFPYWLLLSHSWAFLPHFRPHLSPWTSSIFSVHTNFSWSIPTLVVLSTMLTLMTSMLILTSRLTPPIAYRAPRLRSPIGVPVLWVQRLPGVLCWNCSSKLLQSNWFPSRCSGQKILGILMDASLSHPHTIAKKSCWLDLQNRTRIWPLLTPSAAAPWTKPCHPTWIFSSSTPAFQVLLALTLPSCTQNSQHQSCSNSVQMHVRAWLSPAHTAERAFILLTGKLQSFQGRLTHLFTQLQPRWPLCCSHHLLSLGGSSSWEPPSSLPFSCCCLHVPAYWGLLRPPCQELHPPRPPQAPSLVFYFVLFMVWHMFVYMFILFIFSLPLWRKL